ncbi:MAG: alpha-glucosidase family protein [Candidatus Devosia phytovorans]|uniref:Alpha-glucosidase family protein n=1 Tax=Candidatus Devosia phytovorans TaxID=3121372 RepID=A0AAJ6AYY8_9HYPH|nr:alpha-glucosidase family protein [Devosia sp.]WEK03171.1 MAG: alpha-glucosidase family protein [Devosia sp.]
MTASPLMTEPKPADQTAIDNDWWRGAVIYQIYPRSFQDQNGDGVGDLVGITSRLDYVADLGVDAIWLSPVFTSPMKDFGYDVSDYRGIDPSFGTLEDFDRLVQKAHSLGLKVIIDQVISHSSDKHAWFAESRQNRTNARADWYVWADPKPDGTPPNNWLSIFGGSAWQWDSRRMQYYLHNFLVSQPDLNFHNPDVQDALLGDMRFWLERGVDGFRLDTVNFYFHSTGLESNPVVKAEDFNASTAPAVNPYNFQEHLYDKSRPENLDFLKRLRALMDEYPGKTTVGEIGDSQHQLEIMAQYTSGDDRLHMAYTFDYLGGEFSADHFRKSIAATEAGAPDGWICLAFSNHDVVRHVSRWASHGQEAAFTRLAATLILAMRGSVCLYQGEELGLKEAELSFSDLVDPYGIEFWPEFKGRDGCRTPMVWQTHVRNGAFSTAERTWLPVPAEHLTHAVDTQHNVEGSVLEFYRAVLQFRRAHPALGKGTIELVPAEGNVLAFIRSDGTERLLCVFNMGETEAEFTLPSDLTPTDAGCPGVTATPASGKLLLEPFGAYIGTL